MNTNRTSLMRLTILSLTLIIGLLFYSRSSSAQDREQLQAKWQKKVRDDSKKFFNWFKSHITGSIFTETRKMLPESKQELITINRSTSKRKGSFYILSYEDLNDNSPVAVNFCYGINSKYAFKLKKGKNGKDWVAERMVEVTPDFNEKSLGSNLNGTDAATSEKINGFRAPVNHYFAQNILAVRLIPANGFFYDPIFIDPWNIEELPGFQMRSISTDGKTQERVQLNFEYRVEDSKRKQIGVANCQVDFDLEPICYPVKSHQEMKNGDEGMILDWTNEIKKTSEEKIEVKSFWRLKKTKDGVEPKFEESQKETIFFLGDSSESDFALSAFGLPEPPGIEWKKPFPWYLVVACVGTACVGVFFLLRARGYRLGRS